MAGNRTAGRRKRLALHQAQVEAVILKRQDAVSGLLPASTEVTVHGDYTHAWVRDNVYSILAAWGLGMALRSEDAQAAERSDDAVIRLMRGLLGAMMKQSAKVERFKHTHNPLDALHAKYATGSGDPVVGDGDWGHLQLDATALFVLMLAQMTASGLRIVQQRNEVDFVQNLVWYLDHADRTPDFGIWERGHKRNEGRAELNASSVGMAKAALEAIQDMTLLPGAAPSIHVPADDVASAATTLANLLPRESQSKETDAALLSIIGFPAFAVDDAALALRTSREIADKLEGRYGCRRFLRDGHQTMLEDHSRLHYEPGELLRFENIESEWPLFFVYRFLNALLQGDAVEAAQYRKRIERLLVKREERALLPELYFVPSALIDAERAAPHSQLREPNQNVPLVWAQSLFLLALLVHDGLIPAASIDPLGRRLRVGKAPQVSVQFALLAGDDLVAARLSALGIIAETCEQVKPTELRHPDDLEAALAQLGCNSELGLTGRPPRRPGALATSRLYLLGDRELLFLPHFAHHHDSYLHLDNRLLVENLRTEIAYLQRHWQEPGQALLMLRIDDAMLQASGADELLDYLRSLQTGAQAGVVSGPLASLRPHSLRTPIDWIDALPACTSGFVSPVPPPSTLPWEEASTRVLSARRAASLRSEDDLAVLQATLEQTRNPYEQVEVLTRLWAVGGPQLLASSGATVAELTRQLFSRASQLRRWGVVRPCAGLLGIHDQTLEDAVTQLVLRQKRIMPGHGLENEPVIATPLSNIEILQQLRASGLDDPRYRALVVEITIFLGTLIKADPSLFEGTLTLRPWHLLRLLAGWFAREHDLSQDEGLNHLLELSPQALLERLREVISHEREIAANLARPRYLHVTRGSSVLVSQRLATASDPEPESGSWRDWREMRGVIARLPEDFYSGIWELLHHSRGVVIGDPYDWRSRLESEVTRSDMTPGEKSFEFRVEDLLNRIQAAEYRQLCIETLSTLARLQLANPDFHLDSDIVLDTIIAESVRQSWWDLHADLPRDDSLTPGPEAWEVLYSSAPHRVSNCILAAVAALLAPPSLPPAEPAGTPAVPVDMPAAPPNFPPSPA